jgi:N6-adenosine-specific RNA methylase IME4
MYQSVDAPALPNKKYTVLLVDPPWQYRDKAAAGERGAAFKYPTMSLDALKDLKVAQISDDNAALFMWTTGPQMPDSIELLRTWDFVYKTIAFTWVKTNKKNTRSLFWGMGNYSRSNPEYVLLGIRKKGPERVCASVHSVIITPIGEHSQKPTEIHRRIEGLFGDVPRIELFAREARAGWDVWGVLAEGGTIDERGKGKEAEHWSVNASF